MKPSFAEMVHEEGFRIYQQIEDALNTIWKIEPSQTNSVRGRVVARIRAVALVFGVGCLLLVIVSAVATIFITGKYAANHLVGGAPLWQTVQLVASVVVLTILFAIMLRYIPITRM